MLRIQPQVHWTFSRFLLTLVLIAAAAIVIRQSVVLQQRGAMVLLLGLIAVVTWFCGSINGLLALAGGIVICMVLLFAPTGSLILRDPEDWFRLGMFALISLLLIGLQEERFHSQRLVERNAQRLSFALRSARVGLMESNLRTGQLWWSDNLPSMVGRSPDNFARYYNQFFEYVHPEDQDRVNRAFTTMVEEGGAPLIQFRVKSGDGRFICLQTRICALYDESGTPERVVTVVECAV